MLCDQDCDLNILAFFYLYILASFSFMQLRKHYSYQDCDLNCRIDQNLVFQIQFLCCFVWFYCFVVASCIWLVIWTSKLYCDCDFEDVLRVEKGFSLVIASLHLELYKYLNYIIFLIFIFQKFIRSYNSLYDILIWSFLYLSWSCARSQS